MSENLYVFKVIIAGNSGVGKTALVQRFVDGRFIPDTKATIGVDFSLKNVNLQYPELESAVALQIWDMAGENRFRSILPYYIAGTQGLILAFAANDNETLNYLNEWLEVVNIYLTEKIPIILISTKNDLVENQDESDAVTDFMKQNKIDNYILTSALNGQNVNEAFQILTELIARDKSLIS